MPLKKVPELKIDHYRLGDVYEPHYGDYEPDVKYTVMVIGLHGKYVEGALFKDGKFYCGYTGDKNTFPRFVKKFLGNLWDKDFELFLKEKK